MDEPARRFRDEAVAAARTAHERELVADRLLAVPDLSHLEDGPDQDAGTRVVIEEG